MDKNKLKVLREINYVIPKQCDLCSHGQFKTGSYFGKCALRYYKHKKHTGVERQLSVFRGGGCKDLFQLSDEGRMRLGDWEEFLERRQFTRNNRHKLKVRY